MRSNSADMPQRNVESVQPEIAAATGASRSGR